MGTIADKLTLLGRTKADIKAALTEKGAAPSEVFSTYGDEIRGLSTGGGGGISDPADPVEVYRATRPTDWLPMPEPQDDEMYLLFHIPDRYSSLIAFTATAENDYLVEIGTVEDGAFVRKSGKSVASGSRYEDEFFAADFGSLTSDGMKQAMLKVSGAGLKTWTHSSHSAKTNPSWYSAWNIVEISCRLPSGEEVQCGEGYNGSSATYSYRSLRKLRYFSWKGGNRLTNATYMFRGCGSLQAVTALDTSNTKNMNQLFRGCSRLISAPPLDTSNLTSITYMFHGCYALNVIPNMDTSNVTSFSQAFSLCYALTKIPELDLTKATSMNNTFENCHSLSSVTFKPDASWEKPLDISLAGCVLGRAALVDLFKGLPAINTAKTLTITGNPGAAELTNAEKAIATQKGWTLAL